MSFARYFLVFSAVTLAISILLSYRSKVHGSIAADYAPQAYQTTLIPSRTEIHVVLPFGIAESSKPGDGVVAFVTAPVRINDEIAVPSGAQVKGTLSRIEEREGRAAVRLDFSTLVTAEGVTDIQSEPVLATVPLETDFEVLGRAFGVATRAAVAAGIGANSRNEKQIGRSVAIGTALAIAPVSPNAVLFTVVLTQPVNVPT